MTAEFNINNMKSKQMLGKMPQTLRKHHYLWQITSLQLNFDIF